MAKISDSFPPRAALLKTATSVGTKYGKKTATYFVKNGKLTLGKGKTPAGIYWHLSHPRSDAVRDLASSIERRLGECADPVARLNQICEALWKDKELRAAFERALEASLGDAIGKPPQRPRSRLQKVADKAGHAAARRMVLEGETRTPSKGALDEWADDAWHTHGVSAIEAAGGNDDATDDPDNVTAFSAAFVTTMRERLSALAKKPSAKPAKKAPAKSAPAKNAPAKEAPAQKAPAKKAPAKKALARGAATRR